MVAKGFTAHTAPSYEHVADFFPSLFVVVPLAVLLICIYGGDHIVASSAVSILVFLAIGWALVRNSHQTALRLRDAEFAKWGGDPAVQILRHRNGFLDASTKAGLHETLSTALGRSMPRAIDEMEQPRRADAVYRDAAVWLTVRTASIRRFPAVFRAKVAFNFHLHALALRPLGILVSLLCIGWILRAAGVLGAAPPYIATDLIAQLQPLSLIALLTAATTLVFWVFFPRESVLEKAAFAHAQSLLQGCAGAEPTRPRSDAAPSRHSDGQ